MQKASVRNHCLSIPAVSASFSIETRRHVYARAAIQYNAYRPRVARCIHCAYSEGVNLVEAWWACHEPIKKQPTHAMWRRSKNKVPDGGEWGNGLIRIGGVASGKGFRRIPCGIPPKSVPIPGTQIR
jgi:hypothetical protein